MGDSQDFTLNSSFAKQQDIQVDASRTPPYNTFSALLVFYGLKFSE